MLLISLSSSHGYRGRTTGLISLIENGNWPPWSLIIMYRCRDNVTRHLNPCSPRTKEEFFVIQRHLLLRKGKLRYICPDQEINFVRGTELLHRHSRRQYLRFPRYRNRHGSDSGENICSCQVLWLPPTPPLGTSAIYSGGRGTFMHEHSQYNRYVRILRFFVDPPWMAQSRNFSSNGARVKSTGPLSVMTKSCSSLTACSKPGLPL